jgi:hypothetical protein
LFKAILVADHVPVVTVPNVVILDWPIYAASISITGVAPPVDEILLAVPETLVTVPAGAAAQTGTPPVKVRTFVLDPTANLDSVLAALAYIRSPVAYVVRPVPPFVGPTAVADQVPVVTVPSVVIEDWPTYAASMSITGVLPPVDETLLAVPDTDVTVPVVGAAHVGTPPVSVKTFVLDPTGSLLRAVVVDAYRISPTT